MRSKHTTILLAAVGLVSFTAIPRCVDAAEGQLDFSRDIRPILSDKCFHCHGPDSETREADLRLDSPDGLFGDRGGYAAVVPGKPDKSVAIRRITSADQWEQMPPPESNRHLSSREKQLLIRWVQEGASWRQHWAFVPPERPWLPDVQNASWARNPIDRFILARLEQEGLRPSPSASQQELIRRVTLDLTGLPPTPVEVNAFLTDTSPGAYERVVDRLLASPGYGERMVWDWLDAARYADSSGYQGDPERTMWPWRDWAIRAMNENMPFDQFTIEQLAGDLLPDATPEQILATGFNRNHMHNGEGGRIPEETRVENVMDRTETTATVWLGLTMTCCRCHDHKYDPLGQEEYYRLYAFFNNSSEDGGGRSGKDPPTLDHLSAHDRARRTELDRRVQQAAAEVVSIERSLAPPEGDAAKAWPESIRTILQGAPQRREDPQLKELIAHFQGQRPEYAAELAALQQALEARNQFQQTAPVKVMVMDEKRPRPARLLERGSYDKPTGEPLTAGVPAVLPPLTESESPNRLDLARWLMAPDNPLTARVTVNRYWQTFFGSGLVRTVEDFGAQGELPTHPQLLDWLATEFIASGWDVKHIHKLIVTSATYRQSSRVTPERLERDPQNRLWARGPRYRLPSWMIRDQALAASGLLVHRVGGPPVKSYQPPGIWAEATFGKKKYTQDRGDKLYRRSVYTFWRRIVGPPLFFDAAKRQTCTVKQVRTNTPLHALTTLNDITYVEAARALAQRALLESGDTDASRIEYAFRCVTGRRPESEELELLIRRVELLRDEFAQDIMSAQQLLQVGESLRDESLDAVQHAAYTALGTLLLNLDETLTKQ